MYGVKDSFFNFLFLKKFVIIFCLLFFLFLLLSSILFLLNIFSFIACFFSVGCTFFSSFFTIEFRELVALFSALFFLMFISLLIFSSLVFSNFIIFSLFLFFNVEFLEILFCDGLIFFVSENF